MKWILQNSQLFSDSEILFPLLNSFQQIFLKVIDSLEVSSVKNEILNDAASQNECVFANKKTLILFSVKMESESNKIFPLLELQISNFLNSAEICDEFQHLVIGITNFFSRFFKLMIADLENENFLRSFESLWSSNVLEETARRLGAQFKRIVANVLTNVKEINEKHTILQNLQIIEDILKEDLAREHLNKHFMVVFLDTIKLEQFLKMHA